MLRALAMMASCWAGNKIGQHEREHHGFGRMAAGIAEGFFQFAVGEVRVSCVRTGTLVKILGLIGHGFSLVLNPFKKSRGLGQVV